MADLPYFLDEPSSQEEQAALAAALRKQQALGLIGQLTGNKTMSSVGQNLVQGAQHGQQLLAQARDRALARGLEAKKDAETRAYQQEELGLRRASLNQGKYISVPTEQGFVPFNTRTGKYEEPSGLKPVPKASAGSGVADGLTPGALDAWAQQFHLTGQLPQLGQGTAGARLRVKIANRALEMFPDTDLAGAKAGYSADSKSLAQQQRQADAMNAFEGTALANLDTFLGQAKKVVDVGSPLFNAPGRKFSEAVAGNPEMAAFNAARQTAVQEIGKVLSGSLGGQAISDSARHEVESLLSPDASLAQIQRAAEILKTDMRNRKKAVQAQIDETRGRIGGKPPAAVQDGESGAKLNPGEVLMLDPKGRPHAVADKDVADAEAHGWKRR